VHFVALGNSLDIDLLKKLSPYVIKWDIDNKDTPDDWENKFWEAYGCSTKPPVTGPTTLPPSTTPGPSTTSKPVPYIPCDDSKGREIAILFDNGKNLKSNEYQQVVGFLQSRLFNYWTHYERLVLGYYNRYVKLNEPGSFLSQTAVYTYLKNVQQSPYTSNLRR
jgi:hypothetical protein